MSRRAWFRRSVSVLLVSCALLSAAPLRAEDIAPYDDRDSNVLKVAYYFTYPVGKLAELLVFRPLHTVSALSQPDPDVMNADPDEVGDTARCLSLRPSRLCSRPR